MKIIEEVKPKMTRLEFDELIKQIANLSYIHDSLVIDTDFLRGAKQREHNEAFATFISALRQNYYVKKLSLINQGINDEDIALLSEIQTLEEVNLDYNFIQSKAVLSIAKSNIRSLSLTGNIMNLVRGLEMQEMTEALCKNKTIIYLKMSLTKLSYVYTQILEKNTTLKILDLSGEYFNNQQTYEAVRINKTLQHLDLSKTNINDWDARIIAKNSSLHTLIIDESEITNKGGEYLSKHPTLKVLSIIDSNMTAEGLRCFLNSNLEKLIPDNVEKNLITELELCEFFREFDTRHHVADVEVETETGGIVDALGFEIM